ncbi:MAG: glycosyltransferase family 2 protein, partial [Candidatus Cryptobacteroides sp.]
MRPQVTVVIPVYNTRDFVGETVQSVLDQSLAGVEVIAVDDGSTDGSLEVLRSFGDRIKVIVQANSGQAAARNAA